MQQYRFYCENLASSKAELTGPEAHHAVSVLRLTQGQMVELFDGRGALANAEIEKIGSNKVVCRIEHLQVTEKPNRPGIIIAASVPKTDRFDLLIAKCTELGVDRIVPVIFERTVKQPKNPKATDRWQNVTVSAAKQCKRLFLPPIDSPLPLAEAVSKLTAGFPSAHIFFGSLDENVKPLIEIKPGPEDVIAFIGPEGGLTGNETGLLTDAGAVPVRITDTILRVETAAIAFAAILTAARDNLPTDY
jgi:16S rRNA (uracil1498-N3)-methyltransferase